MGKRFLVILRHAPYGRLDAAEAVRHLSGASTNGFEASLLLLDDGVYLARAGQVAAPGWTELAAALTEALRSREAAVGPRRGVAVFAHATAMQTRGLAEADLVPGCQLADDGAAAELLAAADAALVY